MIQMCQHKYTWKVCYVIDCDKRAGHTEVTNERILCPVAQLLVKEFCVQLGRLLASALPCYNVHLFFANLLCKIL